PAGDGPVPAVVLVHGSGPEDRDETILGTKVFRDLAWGLASRGIAVLRYDKRTLVFPGRWNDACTIEDETIADAVSACAVLRANARIDPARIFIVGHSLGAMVAPEIARRAGAAGAVLMAAAARRFEDVILSQDEAAVMADGEATEDEIDRVQAAWDTLDGVPGARATLPIGPVYVRALDAFDPVKGARDLGRRVLVLQGGRDFQVSPVLEFLRFRRGLAGDALAETRLFPSLDHLFTAGEGKSTLESYRQPKNVDEAVVAAIATWIAGPKGPGK
ncbi:MAG: alpha/beta hydrolase family protein, partial [Polyangiaceae bacterium]